MNGSIWTVDPYTKKRHHPDCPVWKNRFDNCTCEEREDELVEVAVGVLPDPSRPYQSLASMIRTARRDGLLRPLQPYGGGHAPSSAP
jgi:hypothetical protein